MSASASSSSASSSSNGGGSGVNLAQSVLDTLSYVRKLGGETILIKLGGAALKESDLVESICEDFALIQSVGLNLVLVHGGGPSINEELTIHGITWEFIDGQRVTTPKMMDIVEMVLCGQVNRRVVRTLNHAGVHAVGLSGADGRTLLCKQASVKLGQVGTVDKVDVTMIRSILNSKTEAGAGYIPVIAPVGMGKSGQAFNVNADWAACHIALALGIKKILYLTDQNGILDGQGQLISELDAGELENLIETGVVKGGMLAKAQTMLYGLKHGVKDIYVLNARKPHGLIEELFTNRGVGTVCRVRSRASKTKEVGVNV